MQVYLGFDHQHTHFIQIAAIDLGVSPHPLAILVVSACGEATS